MFVREFFKSSDYLLPTKTDPNGSNEMECANSSLVFKNCNANYCENKGLWKAHQISNTGPRGRWSMAEYS